MYVIKCKRKANWNSAVYDKLPPGPQQGKVKAVFPDQFSKRAPPGNDKAQFSRLFFSPFVIILIKRKLNNNGLKNF